MSSSSERSTSDLLESLTDDVSRLVRQELRRAQAELADKARQASRGGMLLGGAGIFAALAAGSSAVFLQRVLDTFLPPRLAAAVATTGYGAAGATLAIRGVAELRQAMPLVPAETVTSLRDDVQAVRPDEPPHGE